MYKTVYDMRISDWSSDVCSSDLVRNWVVVRPSAIYGPWDRETLAFFRAAAGPVLPVLGGGGARICLVHAADAAGAIVALCRDGPSGGCYEVSDARPQGSGWSTIDGHGLAAVGQSVKRRGGKESGR